MRIGASLLLIAIGAILRFAVTVNNHNFNVHTIGVILMVVGLVGLVISVIWASTRRRTDVIQHGPAGTVAGTTYVTPNNTVEGPY